MNTIRWALAATVLMLPRLVAADSVVVFHEIHYHPAGAGDPGGEWIELRNLMAVDVDLTGWSLAGGVNYTFTNAPPALGVLPAGGYLTVAAVPANVQGSIGPWVGQ